MECLLDPWLGVSVLTGGAQQRQNFHIPEMLGHIPELLSPGETLRKGQLRVS